MIRLALTRRLFPALLMLSAITQAPALAQGLEQPITHIPNVIIEDDVVYLGDLFDGLGAEAMTPISRAPAPGRPVELDARWLSQLAKSYKIDWQPANHLVRIQLQRASEILRADDFLDILRPELGANLNSSDYDIRLDSPNIAVNLASQQDNRIILTSLRNDSRTGRFTALFEAQSNGQLQKRITLSGRLIEMTMVPVLTASMGKNGVINAQDVEMQRVQVNSLSPNRASTMEQVLGMSPRRNLRAGQPLRLADLGQPVLAERNGLVTIVLRTATMRLTSQGRALDEGGQGDVIRVKNTKSNRTIFARVTAPGIVTIDTAARETIIAAN